MVSYVIGYYSVNLPSQPCLANIKIAEDVLGSPCIYFRHSSYMYFVQGACMYCTKIQTYTMSSRAHVPPGLQAKTNMLQDCPLMQSHVRVLDRYVHEAHVRIHLHLGSRFVMIISHVREKQTKRIWK